MTLHAEPPDIGAGFAKDADVIKFGISARRLIFQIEQNLLETHYGDGLKVTTMTERAVEQDLSEMFLRSGHFSERQAIAPLRNEMPAHAFVRFEIKRGLGALLRREGGKKII